MATLILAVTATRAPGAVKITKSEEVVVASDNWTVFPRESGVSSNIFVNGYEFDVLAEPAELEAALETAMAVNPVVLSLAITSVQSPENRNITQEKSETVKIASNKILVLPDGSGSIVFANGWKYTSDTSVADVATALSATDGSSYT